MNRSAVGSDRLRTCVSHALAKVRWAGHWEQVPQVPLDEMALPDDDADAERFWEKIWAQEQLRRAMADAREFYRARGKLQTFEAFHRSVVLKQPPVEVAKQLGITLNAVHVANLRVTRKLRNCNWNKMRQDERGSCTKQDRRVKEGSAFFNPPKSFPSQQISR